jgi:hypothetical protein
MKPEIEPRAQHGRNVVRLDGRGLAVASYPGAGAAYLGNILLELGLDYVDPYTEVLDEEGAASAAEERLEYRRRLAASARRDQREKTEAAELRFAKTHLLPEDFPRARGVVLLVRDPRDTLWSYYHWRLGFSEEGETRSFLGFLDGVEPLGRRPVDDWVRFTRLWRDALGRYELRAVVSFERLKADPVPELRTLLSRMGVTMDDRRIVAAVESSSFDAMRRHEDLNAADGRRIMRRGRSGEWREWYHGEVVARFQDPAFRAIARDFGYQM